MITCSMRVCNRGPYKHETGPSEFHNDSDAGIANNSDKTKEVVLEIVSPIADKLKVKHVKRISRSGISSWKQPVKTMTPRESKTERNSFVVDVSARKSPWVIIYDVPRTDSNEEVKKELIGKKRTYRTLIEQNLEINIKDKFC